MKVFLLAALLLAVGVAGMAVTIIFKKDGKFPDGEISRNKALRGKGIECAKIEEMRLWRRHKPAATSAGQRPDTCPESGCDGCAAQRNQSSSRS